MKKYLLLSTFLVGAILYSNNSNAQLVQWGIKGGLNASTLTGLKDQASVNSVSSLTSWHAGGLVQFNIPIITLQLDVLYSVQGANFNDVSGDNKIENAYLNLPLVAKLKILKILNVHAGLQYGILLTSKVNGETEFTIAGETTNYKEFYSGGDFAIPVGIGLQLSKLLVDLRYNIGVADISNPDLSTESLNNGVFQASVGFVF